MVYQWQLTDDCRIFHERHEKLNHGDFDHDGNVQKISNSGALRGDKYVTMHGAADIKQTKSNKRQRHEVNYSSRLMATLV